MVIKDAKKYNSEGPVQKKNKTKKATRNPLVVVIDDDGDAQFGLPEKAKGGKKKHSIEGNSSNPKKKEKKKKKLDSKLKSGACVALPVAMQSSSYSESIKEAEKPPKALKKKRKRGLSCERGSSPEIPSRGPTTECQEANFLVGKKRKGNVPKTCPGDSGYSTKRKKKKKKKKKHKLACSLAPSQAEGGHSPRGLPPTPKTVSHEVTLSHRKQAPMQVAGSKGKSSRICCLTSMDSHGTRNGVLEEGSADPTRERQEDSNCKRDHKGLAPHLLGKRRQGTEQEQKKKWKKRRLKEEQEQEAALLGTSAGYQEDHPAVSTTGTLWETKSELKKPGGTQNSEGDSKGHKKKKISPRVANSYQERLENNKDTFDWEGKAATMKKAKRKSKKSKKERGPAESGESSSSFWGDSGEQHDAPKRKARGRDGSEGAEEEPRSKRAKLKEEAKEREDEIQVVAIKEGNCDEVKIDKSRRQALQEEIDRESGKTNAVKVEDESDHRFGQWSTAAFDSAERKAKFLRLLGGFKKGPSLTQESPAKVTKHNMALARQGEEKLQQTLQAEFEKAADWKQRRGAGLGFLPAPQKRAYIDKYSSKSVKFED